MLLDAYEEKVAELFKTTGDTLAIPETLFLHCETDTEAFFVNHLAKAAKKATKMAHKIHPITSLLFEEKKNIDTALLVSAHYFHRMHIEAVQNEE